MPCYALWSSYVEWRITMTISSVPSGDQNSENGKGGWRLTRVDPFGYSRAFDGNGGDPVGGCAWRTVSPIGAARRAPASTPGGADRAGMS